MPEEIATVQHSFPEPASCKLGIGRAQNWARRQAPPPAGSGPRSQPFDCRPQRFSWRKVLSGNVQHLSRAAATPIRFQSFHVHAPSLGEVGSVFVAVDFAASRGNAQQGRLRRNVQKNHRVWQPARVEAGKSAEPSDKARPAQGRRLRTHTLGQRLAVDEMSEDRVEILNIGCGPDRTRWVTGGARIIGCASHRAEKRVPLTHHHVYLVPVRKFAGGPVLERHVRQLERRIDCAVVRCLFGQALEPFRHARRKRKPIRVEIGRQEVFVRTDDGESYPG